MKRLVIVALLLACSLPVFAAGTRYIMKVDGLACPFCAYSIEKKLKAVEGVEQVNVELEKGEVKVDVADGTQLGESQMQELFKKAGFSWRSMTETPL